MYRLFIASCLCVAAISWPTTAAAQSTPQNCELESFATINTVQDPATPGRIIRREFRGTAERPVEVRCTDVLLIAQEIDWHIEDDRLVARGSVVFQQTSTRIVAERGEFDLKTRTGVFEIASGTLQLTDKQIDRSLFGAQEPEAIFSADRIEKTGPQTYRLTNAVFSACVQPSRRWQMTASTLTFTVDKYAILRNAVLQVKDVSLLYLPWFYYPIHEDGRATGFLMPSYGTSSFRGFSLSNAFFWAIGRSQDATIYHDWFASNGQGFGADYRYVGGPNSQGDARVYMIREKAKVTDGVVVSPARRSYQVRGHVAQGLPGRIRFQAQADYFTDAATQQLYQIDLASFAQRTRYFRADLAGNWGRFRVSAQADRNDVLYGTSSYASIRNQPRANVSISEAPILGTPIRFSGSFDTTNTVRYDDIDKPEARVSMFRTDGSVTLRTSLSLGPALSVNPSVTMRQTDWNISRDPVSGITVKKPISRRLVDTRLRVTGPVFTRVFNTPGSGFAERLKHVVTPSVTVTKTSAFDRFKDVVQFDSVDTILGGVTQVTYGVTNSLLARVRQAEGPAMVREVLNLEVSQTYYTNKLAASYDQQYQSSFGGLYAYTPPPSNLSPVRAALNFTPSSTTSGQFGLEYDTQFGAVRKYEASFNTTHPLFDARGSWSKRQVIPGLVGYDDPARADHFLTIDTRMRRPEGAASLGYSTTYDVLRERTLQQRITGFYNAQCCGVAVDYAVTNLRHLGLRNDKRFSISLTLAGIGSFTNPLGVFGSNGNQR